MRKNSSKFRLVRVDRSWCPLPYSGLCDDITEKIDAHLPKLSERKKTDYSRSITLATSALFLSALMIRYPRWCINSVKEHSKSTDDPIQVSVLIRGCVLARNPPP